MSEIVPLGDKTDAMIQSLDLAAFPINIGKDPDEQVAKPTDVRCRLILKVFGGSSPFSPNVISKKM